MEKPIHVYENLLWDIIDDSSKIYILTLLIENNFSGECIITSVVVTIIRVTDEKGSLLKLPINILDILNN